MQEALLNTTIQATFVSHKRGQDVIHPERAILKINNVHDRKTAANYINNAVLFTRTNKNGEEVYNNGVITRVHGRSGAVLAKFERNMCPKSIGETVFVKLYKIENGQL